MSYRVFKPQEYPLPFIIEDVTQWPIAKLSRDSDAFTAAVQQSVVDKIVRKFKSGSSLKGSWRKSSIRSVSALPKPPGRLTLRMSGFFGIALRVK